jgi:zinc protease|nr:insulinase family protein [Kofleriaceae bacterium]
MRLVGWPWCLGSLLIVAATGACASLPPPPPAPPREAELGLQISSLTLTDDLRVVLVEDPRASEVQVTMRYQVGGVDDPPDQPGIAHLVEHLMYQQLIGAQTLFAKLEQDATYFNGETTFDGTTYVARSSPEHLDELLTLEAIRVGVRCTTISESTFEREREVVINEIRQHGVGSELRTAIDAGLYPDGHPYRRAVGGSPDTLAAITRDQACAFADAHYTPGNAVLVVSGNLTTQQLATSLAKVFGHTAKRVAVAQVAVPAPPAVPRRLSIQAPIDGPALLLAWPLPADPVLRTQLRAVAPAAQTEIESRMKGSTALFELGDTRAPMLGLLAVPGPGESLARVHDAVEAGLMETPALLKEEGVIKVGELVFDRLQQTAIYDLFASLEGGSERDTELAEDVLAGRDPRAAVQARFQALRAMTRDTAFAIAHDQLTFARATVVDVMPAASKKTGHRVELASAVHDLGMRRDPPDPEEARHAMTGDLGTASLDGVRTRTLPNGMTVVLMPLTSVPAIDIRLVFAAGTADEPAAKRGVAELAAHGLTWDLRYLNDLLLFVASGGRMTVEVGADSTSFVAEGLDMHVDLLLAGLRRWIRDGVYTGGTDALAAAFGDTARAASDDDDGALTDAWGAARFGAGHPYVCAGRARCASARLATADATRFRADHFTPDNATLVIAGRFDAALVDRWIDYLFADWTGTAGARSSPAAEPHPAALAKAADTAQVYLAVSLPATSDRAQRPQSLVAAEMLSELAEDVRHQLGATYGLAATLAEGRLASSFVLRGWIESGRAREAVALLAQRLDALRADPDAAARAFVTARARVVHRMVSITGSAASLAERAVHDVEVGQAAPSNLHAAIAVSKLTIDDMAAALAELDLAKGSVLMTGPRADLDDAFAAIGRTPTYFVDDPAKKDDSDSPLTPAAPTQTATADEPRVDHFEAAMTEQPAPTGVALGFASGFATGTLSNANVSGFTVAGELGVYSGNYTFGLHASIGHLTGQFDVGDNEFVPDLKPATVTPLELSAVLTTGTGSRFWAGFRLGVHADHVVETTATWQTALSLGLEGGVDLYVHDRHRAGLYVGLVTEVPDVDYAALTLGVAYRR